MIVSSPFLQAACLAANWKISQAPTSLEALQQLYVGNARLVEDTHPELRRTPPAELNGAAPDTTEAKKKANTLLEEMRQFPADFLWVAEQLQTPKIAERAQKISELDEYDLAELLLDQWEHQQRLSRLAQIHNIGSMQEIRKQYLTWMLLSMETLHRDAKKKSAV